MMTKEKLLEALPHGSGIDCDWLISGEPDAWVCENEYHEMNEAGMYVGWKPFKVWIPKDDPLEFEVDLQDDDSGLWEYLCDTIYFSLVEALSSSDKEATRLYKFYPVLQFCAEDVIETIGQEWNWLREDEETCKVIAERMGKALMDCYWDALPSILEEVKNERKND